MTDHDKLREANAVTGAYTAMIDAALKEGTDG